MGNIYATKNPTIWGTFTKYDAPLIASDTQEFSAIFEKDRYTNLCIENIRCNICDSQDACDTLELTERQALDEVS